MTGEGSKCQSACQASEIEEFLSNHPSADPHAACGRARWKIENEGFNVLKQGGYNLEHNFGRGQQNLDAVLVVLNLLAFAFHTVCDLAESAWQRARQAVSSRKQFFETLQAMTAYLVFPSWQHLIETLAFERSPPKPP